MKGASMSRFTVIAPLLGRIWRCTPKWLQGAVTWTINGKVIVGVSGVLLNDADQILLLRHRFHSAGIWGMPGGWLSPGETICGCWRREVKEELNLGTAVETIIGHRATRNTLEFFLLGRVSGGQLKIDPVEILEGRFFSAEELPPMERFHLGVVGRTFRQLQESEITLAVGKSGQTLVGEANSKAGETPLLPGREEPEDTTSAEGDTPLA
jgi:8-oxo-dGTP diphosphatase